MHEHLENGVRLGWLIDPEPKQVRVHQPEEDVQILENPQKLPGDPVLQGFVLDLQPIWRPPSDRTSTPPFLTARATLL